MKRITKIDLIVKTHMVGPFVGGKVPLQPNVTSKVATRSGTPGINSPTLAKLNGDDPENSENKQKKNTGEHEEKLYF